MPFWAISAVTGDSKVYADPGVQAIHIDFSRMWKLNDGEIVFAASAFEYGRNHLLGPSIQLITQEAQFLW